MAKKSAASMSVVASIKPRDARLSPPGTLTDRQKELWLEIVADKPADWFTVGAQSLLLGYVKAIASFEHISSEVEAVEAGQEMELRDRDKLYSMQERQARLIQSFATKMRLTQQARYTTTSAATKSSQASGSRPWD
jgi:hypothetical protein